MKQMNWIDLTRLLAETMPVFPGSEQPKRKTICSLENDGFRETELHFSSHTGTHIDAPAHVLHDAATLDQLPLNCFMGSAITVDCRSAAKSGVITLDMLFTAGKEIKQAEFVLLYTGWDQYWGKDNYFSGFPCLTQEAASFLKKKKGIGVDAVSVDPVESRDLPIHHVLLQQGILIVENLCNLERTLGAEFLFCALPLHFEHADGAPVRAAAILQKNEF